MLRHRNFTVAVPHFLQTFSVPLFVPLPYFICGRFVYFSTRRNKSLHTKICLSFAGKNGPLYCHLFSSISLSVCLSLLFGTSLTFLLSLLSAVLIAVAFCHLATKTSFYFACFYFYFALWLLPSRRYCFRCSGCRAVLRFSPPFLLLYQFHRCHPFYRCSASNIVAFH